MCTLIPPLRLSFGGHSAHALQDVLKQADSGAVKVLYLFFYHLFYSAVRENVVILFKQVVVYVGKHI